MQRISSSLAEHAVAVMPAARKEWARAMRAELASLDESSIFGGHWAACELRTRREYGTSLSLIGWGCEFS
jgi:hypothetical protein